MAAQVALRRQQAHEENSQELKLKVNFESFRRCPETNEPGNDEKQIHSFVPITKGTTVLTSF